MSGICSVSWLLISLVVSLLTASTGREITDGKALTVYHYGSMPILSNHCSQVGCKPPQTQCCLGLLCSTRLQWNFHYFQRGCSFLGGPRHVSAPTMCKYVCISVCTCQGVCVLLLARFVNKFCACGFCKCAFFAQNCTSHGFPSHVISHGCNLRG